MWSLLRNVRYLSRYRRLALVLSRHGLGWLADHAGLTWFLSWPRRLFRRGRVVEPLPTLAQRLCRALEALGPSYVLLGRYLSTRVDVLPLALAQELACLPAGPAPMPAGEVRPVLEQELGRPIGALFSDFADEPCCCGWLDQVHLARTPEGLDVLVSVPNLAGQSLLERERPFLQELARLVDERPLPGRWQAARLVQGFELSIRQCLDARERGRNLERWGQLAGTMDGFLFPKVDWERSSARVLTWQTLRGRPLGTIAQEEPGEREDLARALYRFFAAALFQDGLYPLPPDLGRWVALEDGRLTPTAFAPLGYLNGGMRQGLLCLLEHFQQEQIEAMITTAVELGLLERRRVSAGVYQAARHLIERYHGLPLAEFQVAELAEALFSLVQRGTLAMPEELSTLLCTLVAVERLGGQLSPAVGLAEELARTVEASWKAQHAWSARQERLLRAGQHWLDALEAVPRTLADLLVRAEEGDLLLGMELRGWEPPMRRLRRMVVRLILSVITAGLLIALTLLVTALPPDFWTPWGWIPAVLSALVLAGLGFLLFLSFLRR